MNTLENYIIYTLILIILMYLIAHILRLFIYFILKLKFDFCPKCFSIFSTWIILLFYKFVLHNDFPNEIIILLIGGSVTGISYALHDYLKKKNIDFAFQDFLIQFIFTILGMMLILIIISVGEKGLWIS